MTIGSRIKARRNELNLSQDELAKRLGYKSRSSINKIELDQRNLTQSKIKAIADALETTPAYIMGWEDGENEEKPIPKNEDGLNGREHQIMDMVKQLTPEKQDFLVNWLKSTLEQGR